MSQDTKDPPIKYTWKPPVSQREEVATAIAESGLSKNAYLTQRFFGKRRSSYPAHVTKAAAMLLAFLGPISSHQRRVEKLPSDGELHSINFEIRALLTEIRSALFQILGRKP